ncbi:MAG: hypothetical protein LBR41_00080 [Rickettsiales bacterium]|nr:hypothetical protein [Rickettsiales bacterium]
MTEEQAWQAILSAVASAPPKSVINIISGRSGILRERVGNWAARGALRHFVGAVQMDNPGSYIIKTRAAVRHEIVRTPSGWKIVES